MSEPSDEQNLDAVVLLEALPQHLNSKGNVLQGLVLACSWTAQDGQKMPRPTKSLKGYGLSPWVLGSHSSLVDEKLVRPGRI